MQQMNMGEKYIYIRKNFCVKQIPGAILTSEVFLTLLQHDIIIHLFTGEELFTALHLLSLRYFERVK